MAALLGEGRWSSPVPSSACQYTAAELDWFAAGPARSPPSALAISAASSRSSPERVVAAGCTSDFVITAMSSTASESAGSVIATKSLSATNPTGTAW